ncbi:MAG TPA: YCF48-related protein, partial [Acidimicrobiia bacterium]
SGVEQALFSVYFADEQRGWVTGQDGLILHTADGGKSWAKQESNAVFTDMDGSKLRAYLFSITGLDAQRLWAVGDRSMLVQSTDGGATWASTQVKMQADLSGGESMAAADPVFYDVAFADEQRGWIVGEFGKIMYTADGGATWAEQNRSLLEGSGFFDPLDLPSLFGVYVIDAQHVVASGLEGHVARTRDGGTTWAYDKADVQIPLLDPLFDLVEFPDGRGWAVGAAGEVMRRESGESAPWKRSNMASDLSTWLRAIDFVDEQTGWMVGGFGLIFRTTDGGKTWLPSQG